VPLAEARGGFASKRRAERTDDWGDQFNGTALVEVYDTAGNFVFAFDGTYQGRRATIALAP
jgi:hypothetical protein